MIIEQSCDMARCGGLESALALVRSHISHTASLIWRVHPRRLFQIEKYAAEHSEMEWIVGGGWDMSWFPDGLSLASVLDRVMPDRPAVFRRVDGHAVVSYRHRPTPLVLSPSRAISPTHRTPRHAVGQHRGDESDRCVPQGLPRSAPRSDRQGSTHRTADRLFPGAGEASSPSFSLSRPPGSPCGESIAP